MRRCEKLPLFNASFHFSVQMLTILGWDNTFQGDVGFIADSRSIPSAVRKPLLGKEMLWLLAAEESK